MFEYFNEVQAESCPSKPGSYRFRLLNKVTGGLLFIFPLILVFIDLKHSAAVICSVATIAAFYEGYLIQSGKTT